MPRLKSDWEKKCDIADEIKEKMAGEIFFNKKTFSSENEMKERFNELANSPEFNLKLETEEEISLILDYLSMSVWVKVQILEGDRLMDLKLSEQIMDLTRKE